MFLDHFIFNSQGKLNKVFPKKKLVKKTIPRMVLFRINTNATPIKTVAIRVPDENTPLKKKGKERPEVSLILANISSGDRPVARNKKINTHSKAQKEKIRRSVKRPEIFDPSHPKKKPKIKKPIQRPRRYPAILPKAGRITNSPFKWGKEKPMGAGRNPTYTTLAAPKKKLHNIKTQ
ncbi:hypothetical protein KAR10_07225 [bacterium]|nr:hypothetical protein [bacterium]